jgi:hypothetical protein
LNIKGSRCSACQKDREEGTPLTPPIVMTENQWRCSECTLVNEIDWNSKYKTICMACETPNSTIDELIDEKRAYEREEKLKSEPTMKPYCRNCYGTLVNGDCLKCATDKQKQATSFYLGQQKTRGEPEPELSTNKGLRS